MHNEKKKNQIERERERERWREQNKSKILNQEVKRDTKKTKQIHHEIKQNKRAVVVTRCTVDARGPKETRWPRGWPRRPERPLIEISGMTMMMLMMVLMVMLMMMLMMMMMVLMMLLLMMLIVVMVMGVGREQGHLAQHYNSGVTSHPQQGYYC